MKKLQNLGKVLSKNEQKSFLGGLVVPGGSCGTVCYNCAALSVRCTGDCTPNDHGVWCNGNYYPCPTGNYC